MVHHRPDIGEFRRLAERGNLVPVYRRLFSDQLTPVLAYRRLVRPDQRTAPSFLFESVVGGERQARYSFMGAQPVAEVIACGRRVSRRVDLDALVTRLEAASVDTPGGDAELELPPQPPTVSNMPRANYEAIVDRAKRYIAAGDVFQVVLSQRFERVSRADPFDVYRALRVVNPSPYMIYLQAAGCMLVGSSPEILCRVEDGVLTNRPLAGTRQRGATEAEDRALEAELLADPKERAEHIMLVDLGRNDVGKVCRPGSVELPAVMQIERYSHVMHISSTVTGRLREGLDCWDALRSTLPVGTVSGAPKVRAMQIIDELEPTRRGPYAGAIGYADFAGDMDMAIALRTMVVMPGEAEGTWRVHLQAGAGIVADSVPASEYAETVNKAAALAKAIDVAEAAFVDSDEPAGAP